MLAALTRRRAVGPPRPSWLTALALAAILAGGCAAPGSPAGAGAATPVRSVSSQPTVASDDAGPARLTEHAAGATPVALEPVKLAASTMSLTILPHLLAKSEGFYEAEGLDVDAAILSPPYSSDLVSRGYPALAHASDIPERYPFVGLTTSREQLQRRPEQAVKMNRALLKSIRMLVDDRARIREILVQSWDVPPAAADAAYDEIVRPLRLDGRMSDDALQAHLDRSHQAGLISRPLKVSDVYDFSYLEQAARTR
jgi:ABC-type nitrate/sulfonate/bicarbonate transport system substrate-binding protein